MNRCDFCTELNDPLAPNALSNVLKASGDWRMKTTEVAGVIPSIGPLSVGHVLVCPRAHVTSSAMAKSGVFAELWWLAQAVSSELSQALGLRTVIFEHGPGAISNAGACVDHAHLHVVPIDDGIADIFRLTRVEWSFSDQRPLQGDLRRLCLLQGYLLANADGVWGLSSDIRIRSQEFRRTISAAMGRVDEWDWAMFPAADRIRATLELNGLSQISAAEPRISVLDC